jgi:hypothetical protein
MKQDFAWFGTCWSQEQDYGGANQGAQLCCLLMLIQVFAHGMITLV